MIRRFAVKINEELLKHEDFGYQRRQFVLEVSAD